MRAPEDFSGVTTRAYTDPAQLRLLQPVPQKQTRRAFTTADRRAIRRDYTEGCLSGSEMAAQLDRTYLSFRQFIQRNPELAKRNRTIDARAMKPAAETTRTRNVAFC